MFRKKTIELSRFLLEESRNKERKRECMVEEDKFMKKIRVHSQVQTSSEVAERREIHLTNKITRLAKQSGHRIFTGSRKTPPSTSQNHLKPEASKLSKDEKREGNLKILPFSELCGQENSNTLASDPLFVGFSFPGNERVVVKQEFVNPDYELGTNAPVALLQEKMMVDASTQTEFGLKDHPIILFERLRGKQIVYFTDFSLLQFNAFFNFIYNNKSIYPDVISKFTCCSTTNQLLLTLFKYKLNPDFKMLSALFNVTPELAFKIFKHWTEIIYTCLKGIGFWSIGTRSSSKYRVCLHCMTVPRLCGFNSNASSQTSMQYRCLIGINEGGIVTFCSDLCDAQLSLQEVFISSNILDLLSAGDTILTNGSFQISEIAEIKGVTVNNLPFVLDFEPNFIKSYDEGKHLMSRKIHSDRLVSLCSTYKILSSPVIPDFVPIYSKIVYNCAMLCNFKPKKS